MSGAAGTTSATSAVASTTAANSHAQGPAIPQAGNGAGTVIPQAGNSEVTTPSSQNDIGTSQAQPSQASEMSREEAIEALRKERLEAARYRKKAQEYDDRLKQEADAKLSETERLQKQYAEVQQELKALRLEKTVSGAAADLGVKPELVLKLITESAIVYDDKGVPTNIRELFTQASKELGLDSLLTPLAQAGATPPAPPSPVTPPVIAQAPQTGATNPPRSGQIAGSNGMFAAGEIPSLTDSRLWKR